MSQPDSVKPKRSADGSTTSSRFGSVVTRKQLVRHQERYCESVSAAGPSEACVGHRDNPQGTVLRLSGPTHTADRDTSGAVAPTVPRTTATTPVAPVWHP